jgi:hypothetical protein
MYVFKRDWTTCSTSVKHCRVIEMIRRILYDYLMSTGIFTLMMNEILIHMSSKNYGAHGYGLGLHLLIILH